MKTIILFTLLTLIFSVNQSDNNSLIQGTYLCDNKLQLEELRISDDEFILYHHSHVDGTYQRKGKVELSGDTIKLAEKSNTIKSTNNLLQFHNRLVYKTEHLFVIFKNKKGKDYIQNSTWNYSKTSNNNKNSTKPEWYNE